MSTPSCLDRMPSGRIDGFLLRDRSFGVNGIDGEHLIRNVFGEIAREAQRRFRNVVGGRHPLDLGRAIKIDHLTATVLRA
jgi:hypothetical protein